MQNPVYRMPEGGGATDEFAATLGRTVHELQAFCEATGMGLDEYLVGGMGNIIHFPCQRRKKTTPRDIGIPPNRAVEMDADEAKVLAQLPVVARLPVKTVAPRALQPIAATPVVLHPVKEPDLMPQIAFTENLLALPPNPFSSANFRRKPRIESPGASSDSDDELLRRPADTVCPREAASAGHQNWLKEGTSFAYRQRCMPDRYANPSMDTGFASFAANWGCGRTDPLEISEICSPKKKRSLEIYTCLERSPKRKPNGKKLDSYKSLGIGSVRTAIFEQKEADEKQRQRAATGDPLGGEALGNDAAYKVHHVKNPWAFSHMSEYTVSSKKSGYKETLKKPGCCMLVQHDDVSPSLGPTGTVSKMLLFGPARKPLGVYGQFPWTSTHLARVVGGETAIPAANGHYVFGVAINNVERHSFALRQTEPNQLFVVAVKRRHANGFCPCTNVEPVNFHAAAGQVFPRWLSGPEVEKSLENYYANAIIANIWENQNKTPAAIPNGLTSKKAKLIREKLCAADGTYRYENGPPMLFPVDGRVKAALVAHKVYKALPDSNCDDDRRKTDPFKCAAVLQDYHRGTVLLLRGGPGAPNYAAVNLQAPNPLKSGVHQARCIYNAHIDHPGGHFPPKKNGKAVAGTKHDRRKSKDVDIYNQVLQIKKRIEQKKEQATQITDKLIQLAVRRRKNSITKQPEKPRTRKEISADVSEKWQILKLLKDYENAKDPTNAMSQCQARRHCFNNHMRDGSNLNVAMLNAWSRDSDNDDFEFDNQEQVQLRTKEVMRPKVLVSCKHTCYHRGNIPNTVYDSAVHTIVCGPTPHLIEKPSGPNSSDAHAISCFGEYRSLLQMTRNKANAAKEDRLEWDQQIDQGVQRFVDDFATALSPELMKRLVTSIKTGKPYHKV